MRVVNFLKLPMEQRDKIPRCGNCCTKMVVVWLEDLNIYEAFCPDCPDEYPEEIDLGDVPEEALE